jgi:carbamate kinase
MLVVIDLGGRALLRPGAPMTTDNQRTRARIAARALALVAAEHQLVVGHGNGPQVGQLALQGAAYAKVETFPVDVLGAQTEETIGYMIEQELWNELPCERPFATVFTMVEVDPADPAFRNPTTFIGPQYLRDEADHLAEEKGWAFKPDGDKWRRIVASPQPKRILELRPIRWLLERNTIVIALGGGGIPTMREPGAERKLVGVECVIDKDLAAELLARELRADFFVMLTDADAVYLNWGSPTERAIRRTSPAALSAWHFSAGSIGPKVQAACRFAEATGNRAAIGALADLGRILAGEAGTTVSVAEAGIVWADRGAG